MNEFIAFVLPPAVALAGARLNRILFGNAFAAEFGVGVKFALGLGVGMLVFSQAVFLCAFLGINAAGALAWVALAWGAVEFVLAVVKLLPNVKRIKPQIPHLWLLLLLPVIYGWWVFGRLSTLEGTVEFDAVAFWVFKSKIIYLTQGKALAFWFHDINLPYMHWYYPTLVSCLYTLGYGAVGRVDEFVNNVWPFWMMVALCGSVLSLGKIWERPHPLPVLAVLLLCFLPASLQFIREEGGTMPMLFYTSLTCLLIVRALHYSQSIALAAAIPLLAGCAATKLEGGIYDAIWFCILLPMIWRRGWLRHSILWKAVGFASICLLPYVMFRLAGPISDPANNWWFEIVTEPRLMLGRFWETFSLNVFDRFFSQDFFHWSTNNAGDISWVGHWTGLGSLFNEDLAVLPWLILFLLPFFLWKGERDSRRAIGYLSTAIIAVFAILALVITGYLSLISGGGTRDFNNQMTDFSSNDVGRYYYPFFAAWFLGIISTSFPGRTVVQPDRTNGKG